MLWDVSGFWTGLALTLCMIKIQVLRYNKIKMKQNEKLELIHDGGSVRFFWGLSSPLPSFFPLLLGMPLSSLARSPLVVMTAANCMSAFHPSSAFSFWLRSGNTAWHASRFKEMRCPDLVCSSFLPPSICDFKLNYPVSHKQNRIYSTFELIIFFVEYLWIKQSRSCKNLKPLLHFYCDICCVYFLTRQMLAARCYFHNEMGLAMKRGMNEWTNEWQRGANSERTNTTKYRGEIMSLSTFPSPHPLPSDWVPRVIFQGKAQVLKENLRGNQTAMANVYFSCCSVLQIINNLRVNNWFAVLNNN